jgi:hypothetical protein
MGFLNHNKIFDIDILNLETACSKIRDNFDHVVFGLYLHPNFVSRPIKGILEIKNLTPSAFRWIFWYGRIGSDEVQVRFHI